MKMDSEKDFVMQLGKVCILLFSCVFVFHNYLLQL